MQDDTVKTSVFEAAMRLHESLDASDVVARAMELLPALVEAESWALFLKSEHDERLDLVRAINAMVVPVGPFISLAEAPGPLAQALLERSAVIAAGDRSGGSTEPSLVCIPLIAGRRAIGALQVARKNVSGSELE